MKYILAWWTKPIVSMLSNKTSKAISFELSSLGGDKPLTPQEKLENQIQFYDKNFSIIYENISKNVEIVTDDFGYKNLKHITKNIRTDLNAVNHFDDSLWAIGKIHALSLYNEPICVLDGDFFIKDYIKYNQIVNSNWDVLVQSKEISPAFDFTYKSSIEIFLSLFNQEFLAEDLTEFFYYDMCNYAYNCGHLGFQNFEIKNQFVKKLMKLYNLLNRDTNKIVDFYNTCCNFFQKRHEHLEFLNINCVAEQVFLTIWANYNNLYVKELSPIIEWEKFNGRNKRLNNLQNTSDLYIHYVGHKNKAEFFKRKNYLNNNIRI
jgi:hypothetical protein